jgi:hypothetical protein
MGGEAIGRCGVEGKGKETAVLLLREDERRPSWSFVSKKNERILFWVESSIGRVGGQVWIWTQRASFKGNWEGIKKFNNNYNNRLKARVGDACSLWACDDRTNDITTIENSR